MRETDRRNLPREVIERLDGHDGYARSVPVNNGTERLLIEARFTPIEVRTNDDGTVGIEGYATVYDHPYDVAGGAPYGWSEIIARGAPDASLAAKDDVRLLVNHEGLALARTKSGTLNLSSDNTGLRVDVPSLDVNGSSIARDLASALSRGDVDEMSFAFRAMQQSWDEDYTVRTITELKLYDVSVVTYPANPATHVQTNARAAAPQSPAMSRLRAHAIADRLRLPA